MGHWDTSMSATRDDSKEPEKKKSRRSKSSGSFVADKDLEKEPTYINLRNRLKKEGVTIGDKLGSGSFSLVFKAKIPFMEKSGEEETESSSAIKTQQVAVKIIYTQIKNDYIERFLAREMKIVQMIDHKNILSFIGVKDFRLEPEPLPFVIFTTEYAASGDLLTKIKKLQAKGYKGMAERDIKVTLRQLIGALEYLDKKHIIHRDLKCENIMLDENENVKLGDFGFARFSEPDEKCKTFCGSRAYVAPEILLTKNYYGRPSDVWSVGIILYVSYNGRFPFDERNGKQMVCDQLKQKIRFNDWDGSRHLKSCILTILHPIPRERPNYQQLLSHAFFRTSSLSDKSKSESRDCP